MTTPEKPTDFTALANDIRKWGAELGFQQLAITDTDLKEAEVRLGKWLAENHQGDMGFMAEHGLKRSRPELLVAGTRRIISVRMNYLPDNDDPQAVLNNSRQAYISRYALGRDYHKLMRNRLQKLARRIEEHVGPFGYRAFVDSAPVMEKPLAEKAGLGWIGKHSNIVNRRAGSWFFLGELYTDLPLPVDPPERDHCGRCSACIDFCPTRAIIAPYRVDARLCISYLTIEHRGAIPLSLRPLIGNRIYGCDDCLLACPWNRFAAIAEESDFLPRNGLDSALLIELFQWSEAQFLKRLEGSPIRRLGHTRWLRNIAVALGNSKSDHNVTSVLQTNSSHKEEIVREHVQWALAQCH